VRRVAVQVNDVFEGRLKWRTRLLIRRARRQGSTGLIIQVDLRDPPQSMSPKLCVVCVREGEEEFCSVSRANLKTVRFIPLHPGTHVLNLEVLRFRRRQSTRVERTVVLAQAEVLLLTCDPVQPNVFYRRSPKADTWSLQILR
jgi:hypothetical protein